MKTPTVTTAPSALMPEVIRLRWMSACADEHLKSIATANAMLRGRTYAASGAVVLGKTENEATRPILSATVNGTEAYQTRIGLTDDPVDDPVNVHDDEGLDGDCTCARAQSGWFCKHQVALAMVWRATLEGKPIELDAAAQQKVATAAKRAQTVKDNEQALRDSVLRQDAASLAKELLELAERYREVHRDLQQWRKINTARAKHRP